LIHLIDEEVLSNFSANINLSQGGSTSDPHDFTLGLSARLCWDYYYSQHSSSTQQNEEDQRSKRRQLRRAEERPLFLPACQGSFNNYVDISFSFFDLDVDNL
jgi:hypothetical protein